MFRRGQVKQLVGFMIAALSLIAVAESIPPPVDGKYSASEIATDNVSLIGKTVKVTFNRIYNARKLNDGVYTGDLRSSVTPKGNTYSDEPGVRIRFSQNGLGYFSKFIPKAGGSSDENIATMTMSDKGEAYVQISDDARVGFLAVGDQYKKDGDEGAYKWSEETEIPDLAAQRKISISDIALFPDQLDGKTVELQFYEAGPIKQKSAEEFSTTISCGRGHASVLATVPVEGRPFFKEVIDRSSDPKANTIYATVTLSPKGVVSLEAKGRRMSGAEYRW